MADIAWRDVGRDFIKGGLVAGALAAGAVVANTCTQIDAPTKMASYYQRYTEMRDQIMQFDNLRREAEAYVENFIPNIQQRLDMMEDWMVSGVEGRLNGIAGQYGIDVTKAASMAGSGQLIGYAGRNVVGDNDPCLAAALGLGRDVSPGARAVSECTNYVLDRSVTPDDGSGGLGPNAGIHLTGMLAGASGQWPVLNLYREDLAWLHQGQVGGRSIADIALDDTSRTANTSDGIAAAVSQQMRVGGIIVGQGGGNITTQGVSGSPSDQTIGQSDRLAQAGRNAYAIEAIAREAATLPRVTLLREQLDTIDIDNLDQLTEGQRHAARVSAQATVHELRTLLHASRLRHEQLEGIMLSIDAGSAQQRLAEGRDL